MRSILFTALMLAFGTAHASTVTLDFQDFYEVDSDRTFSPVGNIESQGYAIDTAGTAVWLADYFRGGSGNLAIGLGNGESTITLSSLDGQAFNLDGFGYHAQSGTSMFLSAVKADGGVETYTLVSSATGAGIDFTYYAAAGLFDNIVSFTLGGGTASPEIDNFQLTAVPIPAAAWLFGSALAGLGWLRRKQTA